MLKIKDTTLNQSVTLTLLVLTATPRETKAKKPYLQLELFDGTDKISGNYWDWAGKNIPDKNTILDVSAQVTEWQGVKQLNIRAMTTNTTANVDDFMPTSDQNMEMVYKDAYALLSDVKDDDLRNLALNLFETLRYKWQTVPGAKGVHHAYLGGTLIHSLSVARIAKSIAANIPEANVDLCVVGALLHDIGKLFTYELDGATIDMTNEGRLHDHIFIGANLISNFAEDILDTNDTFVEKKLMLLTHIVLSHHGKREYGAAALPMCMEAHIVHHADDIDATMEQIRIESKNVSTDAMWTNRIWALENTQHITVGFIKELFSQQ